MSDDDWVTVEGVRYVPEAPLKAEIDRLKAEALEAEQNWAADWKREVEKLEAEIHNLRSALLRQAGLS